MWYLPMEMLEQKDYANNLHMAEESEDNIWWVILNVYQELLSILKCVTETQSVLQAEKCHLEYLLLFKVRTTSYEKYL